MAAAPPCRRTGRARMASRSELEKAGLAALGAPPTAAQAQLISALAAMLALSGRKDKKPAAALGPLPVSPSELFEAIAATGKVLCDPIDKRWFGRLGGLLRSVTVTPADVDLLVSWLEAGGVASWPQGMPTFDHFIQRMGNWLSFAREWNRRGGGRIVKGMIGADAAAEADWGAFKRRV